MGKIIIPRKIAIPNFYSPGKHIYEDQLGWNDYARTTAGSYNSKEIFDMLIVTMGLNLAFYYIDNDTFYGLHRERYPIEFNPTLQKKRNFTDFYLDFALF